VIVRGLWETREDWDLKDTRTLDSPKSTSPTTTPASTPVSTPASSSETSQPAEPAATKQVLKKEFKSGNAVLTPSK